MELRVKNNSMSIKDFEKIKLNWIEHYDILIREENKKIDTMLKKIEGFKAVKLRKDNVCDMYIIIHPSTKKENSFQCTYFDYKGAYMDITRANLRQIIKEVYKSYTEVIEAIEL